MAKKYFVMNDRNDTSKGYTEVTKEFVEGYIKGCGEDKPFFINLGHSIMETTEEHYRSFYAEYERQKYLDKLNAKNNLMSYDALDTDEFQGADVAVDTSEPFEEVIQRKMMIAKIPEALSTLTPKERRLIEQIYFEHRSERDLSLEYGVSHTAIQKRRKRILLKLENFFEN